MFEKKQPNIVIQDFLRYRILHKFMHTFSGLKIKFMGPIFMAHLRNKNNGRLKWNGTYHCMVCTNYLA